MSKNNTVFFGISLLGTIWLCQQSETLYAQPIEDGDGALVQLETAVREEPGNVERRKSLAMAFHEQGQLQRAIEEYRQAIAADPTDVDLYLGLADVLSTANLHEEVETLLRRTADAFPKSIAVRTELAEARFGAGKVAQALSGFEVALEILEVAGTAGNAERASVLKRIGDMHVHMIHFDEALAAYEQAIDLEPENVDLHLSLGRLFLRRNRLEDALREYRTASQGNTMDPTPYEGLAEANLRLGRFEPAIAAAEAGLRIDPGHLGLRYLHATALVRAGRPEAGRDALATYQELENRARAGEQQEREIGSIYKAALAATLDGEGDQAVRLLRDGIQSHPESSRLHLNLGVTLTSLGRHAEAVEVFQKMIESGIGDSMVIRRRLADAEARLNTIP